MKTLALALLLSLTQASSAEDSCAEKKWTCLVIGKQTNPYTGKIHSFNYKSRARNTKKEAQDEAMDKCKRSPSKDNCEHNSCESFDPDDLTKRLDD